MREWWKQAVVYQIYPASFQDTNDDGVGDLRGIIQRLGYIKHLGATVIWISPMYDSPQHDMGYDIRDYKKVYPPYGDMKDMMELLDKAHALGLRVILDLVINHTSNEHEWFKESRSSKSSSKRDWYIWKPARYDENGNRHPPNNWATYFGGSAWEWDEGTQEYYLHLFLREQPDVNFENETARKAIYADAIIFWLDLGIDGFRVDTCAIYSKDQSFPDAPITDQEAAFQFPDSVASHGPRVHEFLKEMGKIISSYGAMSVGECGGASREEFLRYVSAKEGELNIVFLFDVVEVGQEPIRLATKPRTWTVPTLSAALEWTQRMILGTDAWTTSFLENHDVARSVSRYGDDADPDSWARSAKMLALIQATLTGTLFLYQGQEIGMVNVPVEWSIDEYKDCASQNYWNEMKERYGPNSEKLEDVKASLQHLARDNARTPMQWEAARNGGFTHGSVQPWMRVNESTQTINVAQQLNDADSVFSFWKHMLALRAKHDDIFVYGEFNLVNKDNDSVMAFTKSTGTQTALVVGNFTDKPQPMPEYLHSGERKLVAGNIDEELDGVLRPWEGRVIMY